MKSIRTREERLDELRRRRKTLSSDADNAERKLSKMGPDNKNLQAQMDHLNKLREEIRIMDTESWWRRPVLVITSGQLRRRGWA